MTDTVIPPQLAEIIDDFQAVDEPDRLQLLLEFSRGLPELPERLATHRELLEQVVECQTPLFLKVEVDAGAERTVALFFSAPPEAPTTRGFAGVLHEGLNGLPAARILAVPEDVPDQLGLTRAITPLRMRGMTAMLGRIKRQVAAALQDTAALGVDPARVFKTLMVSIDGGLAVAVVPVSGSLDLKKFAAALGHKKAAMADPAAERRTGYVVGGISPLGQRRPSPTVLDSSAAGHPTIFVSGGRRGMDVELAAEDLVRLTGAVLAAIAAV